MDDLHIIKLFFERNELAIRETEKKYGSLCHHIAYHILHNNEDAEECVNDTYIGLWNTIPPTKPKNLMAFVCRIARNLSLKRLESLSRQKRSSAILVSLDELSDILPDESIADGVSNGEISEMISSFLEKEKQDASEEMKEDQE